MSRRAGMLFVTCLLGLWATAVQAAVTGSTTQLSTNYHNVGGTVTVVDDDTFRVDDFTFDGGGPAVYFYLATGETDAEFSLGLPVMPLLSANVFDGTQGPLFFDLPTGETFNGYNAISVWCAQFSVNFGSGTFEAPSLLGDLDNDGFVGISDLNIILGNWNLSVPPADPRADPTNQGFVGIANLNVVLNNWNAGTPPPGTGQAIPEPAGIGLLGASAILLTRRQS
ncbi:MAG: DM13 domain-containing protein [Phycisphaerales bacterium]